MATLVAWNLASQQIRAEEDSGGSGSWHLVQATPAGEYWATAFVKAGGYTGKAQFSSAPISGKGQEVTVQMQAIGWEDGGTELFRGDPLEVRGVTNPSMCPNCFSATTGLSGIYSRVVLYHHVDGPYVGHPWMIETLVELYIDVLYVNESEPNRVVYDCEVKIDYTKKKEYVLGGGVEILEQDTKSEPFSQTLERVDS